ncbi:unnamed protein product, partial [Ixodes persulcatus]
PWRLTVDAPSSTSEPEHQRPLPLCVDRPSMATPLPRAPSPQPRSPVMWSTMVMSWLRRCFLRAFLRSTSPSPSTSQSPQEQRSSPTPTRSTRTGSLDTSRQTSPPSPTKRASADQ